MAYKNIQFNYDNFCIAPLINTYASIDTTNSTAMLQIRNSSGVVQQNFSLSPTIAQYTSVQALNYTGPRNINAYPSGLPFFTMEKVSSTQCVIKRWKLNTDYNRLDLAQTLTFTSDSTYSYNCNAMAVEYYTTSFNQATATGTGYIKIENTFADKIDAGTILYLGPSTDSTYLGAFEEVEVTSTSGVYTYITSTGNTPPLNQYNAGDPITFYKDLFLFSDSSTTTTDKGTLYRIASDDGAIKSTHESAIYVDVTAASFGLPYGNTIGFVKSSNLLFVDITDFEVKKSFALVNSQPGEGSLTAHDLEFTNTTSYRLQKSTIKRGDTGGLTEYLWNNYNYQQDAIFPYADSISIYTTSNSVLHNQETTTIQTVVRDQYGSALNNQLVTFSKTSGDLPGSFSIPSGKVYTNSSGIATINYTSGWYDPNVADICCDTINFSAMTDNSDIFTGSQYIWDEFSLPLRFKYITLMAFIQKIDSKSSITNLEQLETFISELKVICLSKFWNPGGDGDGPKGTGGTNIKQLAVFNSYVDFTIISEGFNSDKILTQLKNKIDSYQLSQTYVSRHILYGNQDTTIINQFKFLLEAVPDFWSEKNSIDTSIWLKLAPFGFDLDASTLSFKVKEISYAGNEAYREYANSPYLQVSSFDAGSGLLGLELTYNPEHLFHYSGIVYVVLNVKDKAIPSNNINLNYWFKLISDYKAPYIVNEYPFRNQTGVLVNTPLSFDIIDLGAGVNVSTLELYVNDRMQYFTYIPITAGYHIECTLNSNFFYGQIVTISILAKDMSENNNILFDTYRFYCEGSTPPLVDSDSFIPKACVKDINRHMNKISFEVYEVDNSGIDRDSIYLEVDNKIKPIELTPIIYRIM